MSNKKTPIETPPLSESSRLAEERSSRDAVRKPFRLLFDRNGKELVEETSNQSSVEQKLADWTEAVLKTRPEAAVPTGGADRGYVALAGWSQFDGDKIPLDLSEQVKSWIEKLVVQALEHGSEGSRELSKTDYGEVSIAVFIGETVDVIEKKIINSLICNEITDLSKTLDRLHEPVIREFRSLLGRLEGRSFGSLEANMAVAAGIERLLNRLGLRVTCLREGCGEPARLACRAMPRMKQGCFQFAHLVAGRPTTHCAFAALPPLRLVPAPTDKRRRWM